MPTMLLDLVPLIQEHVLVSICSFSKEDRCPRDLVIQLITKDHISLKINTSSLLTYLTKMQRSNRQTSKDLHSGRVKGIDREEDGLYVLKVNKVSSKEKEAISAAATYGNEEAYKLWHMRLGHPSQAILSFLSNNDFNFKISF
ncbi:uncharacterized protein LOC125868699 [Solanum stenotomum]|uniref:uncharacterized protein LOC125868699 n=1 Tax=Solanum stenotomum TaxID=172797 RepID=UPI0020D1A077|nr:uncharacterized protein LOC125868699 [Solanum stenotomum]